MKKYKVLVWQHLSTVVTVEAENEMDAEWKVEEMYRRGDFVLDEYDLGDDGIECQGEAEEN